MLEKLIERRKLIFGIMVYWAIYLLGFFLVEKLVTDPIWIVHCKIDDHIPYCKYFLIFYLLWFPYILFTTVYYVFFETEEKTILFMKRLAIPMLSTILFYALLPNGTDLREKVVLDNSIYSSIMKMLWESDTPYNVCPSIHVFVTIILDNAIHHTKIRHPYINVLSRILCIGIILSTVVLKQHSVIDVFGGILVAIVVLKGIKKRH